VPGAIDELELAAGEQIDDPPPSLHGAYRIGSAVDEERWLPDGGELRVLEGQPGSEPRAPS
jgi:hypothetical protein